MASNSLVHRAFASLATRFGYGASLGLPQNTVPLNDDRRPGAIALRGEPPTVQTYTGTTVRVRGFERHPVVQACVRAIVDLAAAIPLQAYRKRRGPEGRVDVDLLDEDDELQSLVDRPSEYVSRRRFAQTSFAHYLVYGNSCLYFDRLRGEKSPPTELRIVHPEHMQQAWVDERGYPLYIQWANAAGVPRTSPITDLLLFRDLTVAPQWTFGYPRAASAISDIVGDSEASEHVRQVVTNYGAPMAYALLHDEATQKDADVAEEKLYESMVRRGQRGRFKFLGVKDVKVVGFSLADLEFPDLRKIAREDICAAFGVDPRMIGIASASNDAGLSGVQYREARARLVQHTVEPLLLSHQDELNHWLSPEFGEKWLRYDPDALKALVEDDQATSTRVQGEVRANLRTIEEGRVAIGLPAEFEPDDTLLMGLGGALVPTLIAMDQGEAGASASIAGANAVAENGGQLPAKTGEGEEDGKEPQKIGAGAKTDDDEDVEEEEKSSSITKITVVDKNRRPVVQSPTLHRSLVVPRSVVLAPEIKAMIWRAFDERAAREEAVYRRQALMLFGEERSLVAKMFERAKAERSTVRAEGTDVDAQLAKSVARGLKLLYKADGEVEQRWQERFHPLIGQTFAKGGEHVASGTRSAAAAGVRAKAPKKKGANAPDVEVEPLAYDFHLEAPNVQQAIADRAKRLGRLVGRTTAEAINDAVAVGVRNHMSISEIAELVDKTAFGGSAGYRAHLIARTETVGALNHGQFFAADESEAVEGKEWLTQGDDRVRDTHAECESAGVIELASPFSNGLQFPGDAAGDASDVVNCRCTLLYYDTVNAD